MLFRWLLGLSLLLHHRIWWLRQLLLFLRFFAKVAALDVFVRVLVARQGLLIRSRRQGDPESGLHGDLGRRLRLGPH